MKSNQSDRKRILVAPLNWGLGHATRCIPIINFLIEQGTEVLIASDGRALSLLKAEFPQLMAFELPAYNVTYNSNNMVLNLSMQLPKIAMAVYREQRWLKQFLKEHALDAIISDNRFGLYTAQVPSVFISHQIEIPIPVAWLSPIGNFLNRYFIKKFDEVWVPDFEDEQNLSGTMSHHTPLEDRISWLGPISRMKAGKETKQYDIGIVLSGPEPQRTRLEHNLLLQLSTLPYKVLLVRGIPGAIQRAICSESLEMVSYMKGAELNRAMLSCDLIISRSGYTTIMDLAVMGKRAMFVPTPGQKEQEDLAAHFHEKGIFYGVKQDDINLETDIPQAMTYPGILINGRDNQQMKAVVKEWMLINGLHQLGRTDESLSSLSADTVAKKKSKPGL